MFHGTIRFDTFDDMFHDTFVYGMFVCLFHGMFHFFQTFLDTFTSEHFTFIGPSIRNSKRTPVFTV
jgi:hypothetical protein